MKNYIVISILLVICTMVNAQTPTGFPKPKFKQPGVYVTYQDFLDDKPILGKELSQAGGNVGEGDWILEMENGSKKKFERGTVWGCLRKSYYSYEKKSGTTDYYTPCRIFNGVNYPIYMYGAVIIYSHGSYISRGDSFVFIMAGHQYVSVGPDSAVRPYTNDATYGTEYLSDQMQYERVISTLNQDAWNKVQKYRGYTLPNRGYTARIGPYNIKAIKQEMNDSNWKTIAGNTYYAVVFSEEKVKDKISHKEYKVNSMLSVPLLEYYNNIMAGTPLKPLQTNYYWEEEVRNDRTGYFRPEHFDTIVPNQPKE